MALIVCIYMFVCINVYMYAYYECIMFVYAGMNICQICYVCFNVEVLQTAVVVTFVYFQALSISVPVWTTAALRISP